MARWNVYIALFLQIGLVASQISVQGDLDDIARNLNIQVEVVENVDINKGTKHIFAVTFDNKASKSLSGTNWRIYFYSFFMVEADHLFSEDKLSSRPEGYVSPEAKLTFYHENGCLFSIKPTADFPSLAPNNRRTITFSAENWAVSKTDIPPNWYITATDLVPRLIDSTALNFVSDFTDKKQWKRNGDDRYNPYSPPIRYDRYEVKNKDIEQKIIIPTPKAITNFDVSAKLDMSSDVTIVHNGFENEANFLANKTGFNTSNTESSKTNIYLQTNNTLSSEAYTLSVDPSTKKVYITGRDASGIFYGIQSLLSMLSIGNVLPKIRIEDEPRFEFRSMYVDLARNFRQKSTLYILMDAMAMYKLNKLHLHLADDEGWRLEISGIPELTDIASKRCQSEQEDVCIIPQLGSGPYQNSSGSGYLTMQDYKDILEFAKIRHIEVIPEVDSPGHARAAIMAMEARFRKYNKKGNATEASRYRLIDSSDTSRYFSVQLFNDNAMNPCIDSTYTFIEKVVTEIKNLHDSVDHPMKIFHFGGDEVAKTAWLNSTACQDLNISKSDLKKLFAEKVANITYKFGLNMAGWEDGLHAGKNMPFDRNLFKNPQILSNAWDNVWEWGAAGRAHTYANAGYQVIMSQATHLYFDHPYEPDPEERGLYWATRFTDTYKTFGFLPDNLYENIDVTRMGETLTRGSVCDIPNNNTKCPPLQKPENIIGMQGHLWAETALTEDNFYYLVFPRILALAERAWHKSPWESETNKGSRDNQMKLEWDNFAATVANKELKRLNDLGISYRVPPPGAKQSGNEIKVNSAFPGLTVEYSTDNQNWKTGTIPNTGEFVYLRTKSADGSRTSRVVKYTLSTSSGIIIKLSLSLFMFCFIANQYIFNY